MPQPIRIDAISFIAGFLAASLFWWIFSKVKGYIPQLRAILKQRAEVARERNREGISIYIRQEALRRAQKAHLAHPLFSLDEVIIQPRLLAPPGYIIAAPDVALESLPAQAMPFMPDWPELSAPYAVPSLTLAEALARGSNILVVGKPGSGKTIVLADLASKIARRDPAAGSFADNLPIFMHALDLDLTGANELDPIEILVKTVSGQVPVLLHPRLPKYLREMCSSRKVILLIDGLDELAPIQVDQVMNYLKRLRLDYPMLRLAASASFEYIDGAGELGFFPFGVAAWSPEDVRGFIRNWGSQWSNAIMPEAAKRTSVAEIQPELISDWLESETLCLTPLEWTLRVWAVYSGDLIGPSAPAAIQAYIDRLSQNSVPAEALQGLAWQLYCENTTALHFEQVDRFFASYGVSAIADPSSLDLGEPTDQRAKSKKNSGKKGQKISSGSRSTQALTARGLLVEHSNGQVRFAHPVIGGYLGSFAATPTDLRPFQHPLVDLHVEMFHYMAAQNKLTPWLKVTLSQEEGPLYQNLLAVCRWLKDVPRGAEWRTPMMRRLVSLIQNEAVPAGIRARIIAAFYTFNDPNVLALFKQMLVSGSPVIRQMAALSIGASQDINSLNDLLGLFTDPVEDVRYAACLALGVISNRTAFNALVEVLQSGEEDLQQIAAEALARTADGQEVLKEATADENLMVRQAAIFGMARVQADWASAMLERIAIEDAHWIIRSTANQALELMRKPAACIPQPLPPTHESPWLIAFVSRLGEGISPGQDVTEKLLLALKTGTPEERLAALQYLREIDDEGVVAGIYDAYYTGYDHVHDAALFALWYLSASGVKLPPPAKYGYFA